MEEDPENTPQYLGGIRYSHPLSAPSPPSPNLKLALYYHAKSLVVIASSRGQTLGNRTIEVNYLLESPELSLNSQYNICKNIIPPLERIFNLVGVNVRQWYDEMPK